MEVHNYGFSDQMLDTELIMLYAASSNEDNTNRISSPVRPWTRIGGIQNKKWFEASPKNIRENVLMYRCIKKWLASTDIIYWSICIICYCHERISYWKHARSACFVLKLRVWGQLYTMSPLISCILSNFKKLALIKEKVDSENE